MKTSNKFTLVRVIAAPIFFIIYFLPKWVSSSEGSLLSLISFCILVPMLIFSELTDYWDGHFARKNNEVSDFGKMFDPFADVFLHLSVFTCMTFSGYMPVICFVLIFYREFAQNFLRMVAAKQGTAIAARKGGKFKTVFYVVSCFVALAADGFFRTGIAGYLVSLGFLSAESLDSVRNILHYVTYGFFSFCVLFAYTSFFDYIKNFGGVLKEASK
ncbi:MAG: CDP-diacylglycerol--glycerol-3-phosphate 3-phosphatidyltransferase [Treponema sp.]|nr:CDP-diacylglycerol--glycerol-3-phosphate 3-phosphatidyltransferase [Treponema sp.]MBR6914535.1 CDP-diacylglycerol--glycerol-3-phosphate 3-phosphatidyltransferase [Treponema sp.]